MRYLLVLLLLTGCPERDWQPTVASDLDIAKYECRREARTVLPGTAYVPSQNKSFGSGFAHGFNTQFHASKIRTDRKLFNECMKARGWQ